MFDIIKEVALELHKLNERKFLPRFIKDRKFRKLAKECLDIIEFTLSTKTINYNTIVDLYKFYLDTFEYIKSFGYVLPLDMINGYDVISIICRSEIFKFSRKYSIDNMVEVTEIYTVSDSENIASERNNKKTYVLDKHVSDPTLNIFIAQVIKYIRDYMTLVYLYGVEENEKNIY